MTRPSPSMAVALAALAVATAGSATAVTRQLLTGADVRNGTLSGADVRNASLTGADVRNGSLGLVDLGQAVRSAIAAPGPRGPVGPAGPAGPAAAAAPVPLADIGGDTQPIPDTTTTEIVWKEGATGIASEDPDAMHDDLVSPTRLTPASPGFYTVQVTVVWTQNATGDRELRVVRHLAAGGVESSPVARQSGDASAITQNASFLVRIEAGDSVAVSARQVSGAPLNLNPIRISLVRSAPLR